MDIPVKAEARCADGPCGRSTCVIVDPVKQQVTHVVVRETDFPFAERLVPIDTVTASTPTSIQLRCTRDEFDQLERFVETEYQEGTAPFFNYGAEDYMLWPYFGPEPLMIRHEHLPPGELAIQAGALVHGTDGWVGKVDEFLIDPTTEQITHIVLREGHLWGKKDVTIPAAEIERIADDTVYLKLSKQDIEALPAVPVRR